MINRLKKIFLLFEMVALIFLPIAMPAGLNQLEISDAMHEVLSVGDEVVKTLKLYLFKYNFTATSRFGAHSEIIFSNHCHLIIDRSRFVSIR